MSEKTKNDELFQTQHVDGWPEPIRRSICGVASLQMVLHNHGYSFSAKDMLKHVIATGNYGVPTVWTHFSIDGEEVEIPITYAKGITDEELIQRGKYVLGVHGMREEELQNHKFWIESRRSPFGNNGAFNIRHGFDYRIVNSLFESMNIPLVSELHEFRPEEKDKIRAVLESKLTLIDENEGSANALMISVYYPLFSMPWYTRIAKEDDAKNSTHVVVAYGLHQNDDSMVHFSDPVRLDHMNGVTLYPLKDMIERCSGNILTFEKK
jgi:hypothetical protein